MIKNTPRCQEYLHGALFGYRSTITGTNCLLISHNSRYRAVYYMCALHLWFMQAKANKQTQTLLTQCFLFISLKQYVGMHLIIISSLSHYFF